MPEINLTGWPWFEWHLFTTSFIGGILFGVYVFLMGDDDSSWRDIVGWGLAVYFFFIFLSSVDRVLDGNPEWFERGWTSASRWFTFILLIVATAGTMRFVRNQLRGYRDRLPQ